MMRIVPLMALGIGLLAAPGLAEASALVVDRGLPTINLNDAAGANRSNVAWGYGSPDFIGDTFTLDGGAGTHYQIDTIRTWAISAAPTVSDFLAQYSSINLFTGTGTVLSNTSSAPTVTDVTYVGGLDYQPVNDPTYRYIYQIDFTGLNIFATGGTTLSFGVAGVSPGNAYAWFNHASNAGLSGSPQDDADDEMLAFLWDGTASPPAFDGTYDSKPTGLGGDGGWDKSSDINVQVFATVPEPAVVLVLGLGLLCLGLARRRRN